MRNTSIINIKTPFGSLTKRYEAGRAGGFGRFTAEARRRETEGGE